MKLISAFSVRHSPRRNICPYQILVLIAVATRLSGGQKNSIKSCQIIIAPRKKKITHIGRQFVTHAPVPTSERIKFRNYRHVTRKMTNEFLSTLTPAHYPGSIMEPEKLSTDVMRLGTCYTAIVAP